MIGIHDCRLILIATNHKRVDLSIPIGRMLRLWHLVRFSERFARYSISQWLPAHQNDWPVAIFFINIIGAFLLGLLLQALLHRGKDEGGRRILRLLIGTGFLGAFTTYSSLATGVILLAHDNAVVSAVSYATVSVVVGVIACMLGIRMATFHYTRGGVK